MKFLEFLHAIYHSLNTFFRHGSITRCTEATHRARTFKTYHTFFGCKLQEVCFQIFVFIIHNETDIHIRTVRLIRYCTTEQLVTVNFRLQHFGFLFGTLLHFCHSTVSLNPAQSLQRCIDRKNRRCIEHRTSVHMGLIVQHSRNIA